MLAELEHRFGYGLDELARRFDRSLSWVSRRLTPVEVIPESVQQQAREGNVSARVATKFLAPVARVSLDDCLRMAGAIPLRSGRTAVLVHRDQLSRRTHILYLGGYEATGSSVV